jgi:hypothetical protein
VHARVHEANANNILAFTMMLTVSTRGLVQIALAVPLLVWAIMGFIMTLESENEGKRATTGFDWFRSHSPRWYRRVSLYVALPLLAALLLSRYFGL